MGLGKALNEMQIRHLKSDVGDRYVMQEMVAAKAILGGEDSGHIIFLSQHTTGDGLLAALQVIRILAYSQTKLSDLAKVMSIFPQTLLNVDVKSKPPISDIPALADAMTTTERKLGDQGRILIRYSGTQPMCRVMVEAGTKKDADKFCQQLSDIIRSEIGA
jgi:phosphoglucosamine mutase